MKTDQEALMKHFSSVLRNRANGKEIAKAPAGRLLNVLSRKDLIEVIKRKNKGSIPKELQLVELENQELLGIIGDEMHILSYLTELWTMDGETKPTPKKPTLSAAKANKNYGKS